MANLMDGLLSEMNRVRKVIKEYRDPIMNGAGELAARIMEIDIQKAERSISNGDVVEMLTAYQSLKEIDSE